MKENDNETQAKEDVRTIRTKRDLANALQELLQDKNFDDIQIQEITDKAMVSKHTFYNNFNDKSDLLLFLFRRYRNDLMKDILPILQKAKPGTQWLIFKKAVEAVVHFFYTCDLPFQKMVRNDESRDLYWNLTIFVQEVLQELNYQFQYMAPDKINPEIFNYFYGGACASMIYFSFLNGMNIDEKQVVKNIVKLALPAVLE